MRLRLLVLCDWFGVCGLFVDVVVGGEIYDACKVTAYVLEVGEVVVVVNVNVGTCNLCFL